MQIHFFIVTRNKIHLFLVISQKTDTYVDDIVSVWLIVTPVGIGPSFNNSTAGLLCCSTKGCTIELEWDFTSVGCTNPFCKWSALQYSKCHFLCFWYWGSYCNAFVTNTFCKNGTEHLLYYLFVTLCNFWFCVRKWWALITQTIYSVSYSYSISKGNMLVPAEDLLLLPNAPLQMHVKRAPWSVVYKGLVKFVIFKAADMRFMLYDNVWCLYQYSESMISLILKQIR